jgi:DNA-binding transcriptional MerR regulator
VSTENELIGAQEVAELLNISYSSLRDYRKRGLIVVAAKRGNKDLYDKADVSRRDAIIREKRRQGFSLSQISLLLAKEPVNVVSLPGPREPAAEMSNQELLHGFLAELYRTARPEQKDQIDQLSKKWHVFYTAGSKKELGNKSG